MQNSFMQNSEIRLGRHTIGRGHQPFIIAEMSGNHNGSLERALQLVDAAAKSGAQALKLQTYTAETMTLNLSRGEFFIDDKSSLWKGRSLYDLYQEAHTPWAWHEPIFQRAREHGMLAFSTPFDKTAVDFLESLDVPCYKVASFENTDLRLIREVASKGKPVIISTGMASLAEVEEAVRTAREAGCRDLILLKCTSNYPASAESSNLATIPYMRELFQCEVGLSDHTMGIGAAVGSVALGATVIEKHFTLSRDDGGVDSKFSLEPHELKLLVDETKACAASIGRVQFGPTDSEKGSLRHRRSLYVSQTVQKGEAFTEKNVRSIRPGLGLPVRFFDTILGKTAKHDIEVGTPVSWDIIG